MIDIATLILLAGVIGVSMALYLQAYGVEVPLSYTLSFYCLGTGFALAAVHIHHVWNLVRAAVVFIILSEVFAFYAVVDEYGVTFPPEELSVALSSLRSRIDR